MASIQKLKLEKDTKDKGENFLDKIDSNMSYQSNYMADLLAFDWVLKIEEACPYIDLIIRIPKNTLIQEENIMLIEKSKKINVSSIKNLAKHTEYINKYDKRTADVEPSKILDIRNEETYNIYENRFLYTLVDHLERFISKKEKLLKDFSISNDKLLEYIGNTTTQYEKVNIQVKLTSSSIPSKELDKKLKEEIESVKKRLKRIKEYIGSWQRSEMMKALSSQHVKMIEPPIKKTNIILKNPNFKIAAELWEYLLKYDYEENENSKDNFNKDDDDIIREFLEHSFLISYFVSDSIHPFKKEEKKKMASASIFLLKEQVILTLRLLSRVGLDLTEEELLHMIAKEMKNDRNGRLVGAGDVKKKFQKELEEYLERTQDYL